MAQRGTPWRPADSRVVSTVPASSRVTRIAMSARAAGLTIAGHKSDGPGGCECATTQLSSRSWGVRGDGDQTAWNQIVERFAPPVWSICRRYRLPDADSNDVRQNVWLRLVVHLPSLREAAALSGWLTTTSCRECLRAQRSSWDRERELAESTADIAADEETTQVDRVLIDSEPNSALRE
jgi:sigma-70-like protein